MFDKSNKDHLKAALELVRGRSSSFYNSPVYLNAKERYETRRNAYYRKPTTKEPLWKSKLYFPLFFLACKGFEARVKSTIDMAGPLARITYDSPVRRDPGMLQMEKIHNFDLNNDLYVSNFRQKLYQMYWFNEIFGTSIARETFVSEAEAVSQRQVLMDEAGNETFQESQSVVRREHTLTEVVHPLNFAQVVNKGEFTDSRWTEIRYEMPISELYAMRNDPDVVQEDLEYVIAEIEKGHNGWSNEKNTYYVDDAVFSSTSSQEMNTLIVNEYSGDISFKGNYDDNQLYYGIYSAKFNKWLRIGKSRYPRHHFWKMRTYPDPMAPYGVGACDTVIPINLVKNVLFNQYVDWGNANLKFMYEVYPRNIKGGLKSLIEGQAGGMLEAIDEATWYKGQLVRPVQKNNVGIPGIQDILNYLERAEVDAMPQNSMRKEIENKIETATQSVEATKKENLLVDAVISDLDLGLIDGIQQKVANRINFSSLLPQLGTVDRASPPVRYFPFELSLDNISLTVRRIDGSADANKYIAWLNQVSQGMKMFGFMPNPQEILRLYATMGRNLSIPEVDEILAEMPVQVNTAAAVPPGGSAGPGSSPSPAPPPSPPLAQNAGAANASALA
jgi:hypothetical protein